MTRILPKGPAEDRADGAREDAPAAGTLHRRILGDIERRIVSGEWQPGFRLPFEVDLAERYGCSRMTVNKVMTELARAGLIERRKKSGSFVRQPRAQSAVLEIRDIEAEVRSLGLAYRVRIGERVERAADAEDRRLMDVGRGVRIVAVEAVHDAGGRPFCLEERRINASLVPEAAAADFSAMAPGAWLLAQVPWSEAEHRIHAAAATPSIARRLDVTRGTACLLVERRTWSSLGPITWARFIYRGDSHTLVARFTPAGRSYV